MREDGESLKNWLLAWRDAHYDVALDAGINQLANRPFGTDEVVEVLRWKLKGLWPKKHETTFRTRNSPAEVRRVTGQAFSAADPALAMSAICALVGVGPAVGSAILMAHDPKRFTVMDVRALLSLRALGRLPSGREPTSSEWILLWPSYLAACLDLARETDLELRVVDQGLWAARGRVGSMP